MVVTATAQATRAQSESALEDATRTPTTSAPAIPTPMARVTKEVIATALATQGVASLATKEVIATALATQGVASLATKEVIATALATKEVVAMALAAGLEAAVPQAKSWRRPATCSAATGLLRRDSRCVTILAATMTTEREGLYAGDDFMTFMLVRDGFSGIYGTLTEIYQTELHRSQFITTL